MSNPWRNWAGDVTCTPAVSEAPGSVDEVADAVRRAAAAGRNVRVVGAGHSFGTAVCTDGTLLTLDRLSGVQSIDPEAGLVTVGAGTRLADLNRLLDDAGLAMPNLGDIDRQSVAGAVSTATHGTGRLLGNLATQIEALQLVLADGSTLDVSSEDVETLAAARVSLGALGVITAYTLRVVPAFNLRAQEGPMPFAEVRDGLDELVDGNDHFEFFVFPHSDVALTKRNNRTDAPAAPRGRVASYVQSTIIENRLLDLVCKAGRALPSRIPQLNRTVTRVIGESERVDKSFRVFASPRTVRFTETEWALPREACLPMLDEALAVIRARGYAVNFPFEVRFVAADEASYLSPSYGRETAYVAAHAYQGMEWQPFFQAVQEIALSYGGRPHWGKRHSLDAHQLAQLYPEWESFQTIRAKLDPEGRFANDHTRRLFDIGVGR